MTAQTAEEKAQAVMDVTAIYSNNVTWTANQMGLRLTFGETSIMEGEPPTHRFAVFIPFPVIRPFLDSLTKTWAEQEQKIKAMVEAQGQPKQ